METWGSVPLPLAPRPGGPWAAVKEVLLPPGFIPTAAACAAELGISSWFSLYQNCVLRCGLRCLGREERDDPAARGSSARGVSWWWQGGGRAAAASRAPR